MGVGLALVAAAGAAVSAGSGLGVALGSGLGAAVAVAMAAVAVAAGIALGVRLGWTLAVMGDVGAEDAVAAWLSATCAAGDSRQGAASAASARHTIPPRITRRSSIAHGLYHMR